MIASTSALATLGRSSMFPGLPRRRHWAWIALCVSLSPAAWAVNPAPDGGYAGGNTAEGTDALFSLQAGAPSNTAVGYRALYSDTSGYSNTAVGSGALQDNTGGLSNTAVGVLALAG